MRLIYCVLLFFPIHLEAGTLWAIFKDTTTPCPFSFKYPKEFELDRDYGYVLENKQVSGILLNIGFYEELGDNLAHPINVELAVAVFKPSTNQNRFPGDDTSEPDCPTFPWKNKVSTVTASGNFKAVEYHYCEDILSGVSLSEEPGDVVRFPHEIIVRVIKRPACIVKLTLQVPMLYDKDYSGAGYSGWPQKDTPQLRKKKLSTRKKLLRSLESFEFLDRTDQKSETKWK